MGAVVGLYIVEVDIRNAAQSHKTRFPLFLLLCFVGGGNGGCGGAAGAVAAAVAVGGADA